MSSTRFEYSALKVTQRPEAPPLYLMHSSAAKLLGWADVPRKKEEFQAGYERRLDDRHEKIAEFLQSASISSRERSLSLSQQRLSRSSQPPWMIRRSSVCAITIAIFRSPRRWLS